jgi:MFS family permease
VISNVRFSGLFPVNIVLALPGPTVDPLADPEAFARAHLHHNVMALGADYALFVIGLSFASAWTILPAFALHLGAPNVVVGAIPAVMTTGWLFPALFTAGHTESLKRRMPFVLRYTIWERVPFLVLALVAFTIADRMPALALALVLLSLVAITGVGGLLMPAWMDVVGRTVPTRLRGRFFAFSGLAAGVGGLVGSFATSRVLEAVAAPSSYGVCFLVAAVFMAASFVALAAVREPEAPVTSSPVGLSAYLRRVPGLLRRDRNFSWFLTARACLVLGTMASGFFTVYGLRVHAAPVRWVGVFTTMLFAGQVAGTLALGWVADRAGHCRVLLIGSVAMVAANVLATSAPTLGPFALVFALTGVFQAAANTSNMTVLLEFAPTPDERPTYIGLGTTFLAPVALGAPPAAGLMADAQGFEVVFTLAAVCGTIGLLILTGLVRDPRYRRP